MSQENWDDFASVSAQHFAKYPLRFYVISKGKNNIAYTEIAV